MLRSLGLALLAAAVLPASASAATVSGTLGGGRGYTVIALSATGQSSKSAVGAERALLAQGPRQGRHAAARQARRFLLRPGRAADVRASARSSGSRPRAASSAGSSLKRGFAAAKAPKAAVSTSGAIRTGKGGAPLGAGNLGFVKMKRGKAKASAAAARAVNPGADPDGDGVPSTFDADDNGNKTLDGVDPVTAKTDTAGLFSDVQVMMARSVNANAGGISGAQVDAFVKNNTSLNFYLDTAYARGATISSVDVDCGALVYCRPRRRHRDDGRRRQLADRRPGPALDVARRQPRRLPRRPGQPERRRRARGPLDRDQAERRPRPTCTPATSTSCASRRRAAC